jgi:mono/diheme cytochrome c family protein
VVNKTRFTSLGLVAAGAAILLYILSQRRAAAPESPASESAAPPPVANPVPRQSARQTALTLPERVTWSEHVAPIVYGSCSRCHRPGEAGPFPLLSYQDAKRYAAPIRVVTEARLMPPWPADPTYRHFAGENVLSDEQIALIAKWVDQGVPEGDRSKAPQPPRFPRGSQISKPDLVVRMPATYRIRGDNSDQFVSMKLPFEMPQDTFVQTVEFVPGNRKLVHHVNAHLMTYDHATRHDLRKGRWFVEAGEHNLHALDQLNLGSPDGGDGTLTLSVTNYLPGTLPTVYPPGIGGFRFTRRGYLVMHHIHYGPSPVPATDSSYFNLFFAKRPPERPTFTLLLGTLGRSPVVPALVIPPNTVKRFTTDFTLPADISVLTINPHMHLLGKTFLAYATAPSGDTIPLIRIPRWDFRWQYFYTFEKMLKLPKGTVIHAEATFDNTANNPVNPFRPPREVREQGASMRSTDEMFQCIITMLPYREGDENIRLDGG